MEENRPEILQFSDEQCIEFFALLSEEAIIVEEVFEEIKALDEKKICKVEKKMDYFSENIIIFSFLIKNIRIWEVYDRKNKKSSYSHIENPQLEKTYLLALINRGEMFGNSAGSV